MTSSEEEPVVSEAAVEPSASLVEIEPGVAVLFSERALDDFEVIPFDMLGERSREDLVDKLSMAVGLGNVAAQGAQGLVDVQGLVQLAPQTLEALKAAQPMMSGGWNLGSLVGNNGQITASVRWRPMVGTQSASVLTALGPAGALLALSLQLASISRRLDENIELTRDILRALHEDQWATLLGLSETTRRAVREAQSIGVVNEHVFAAVATKEADLRKQRHLFTGFVHGHIKALDADAASRRSYIQKNVERILADAHGMLMAEGSWYRSQVLRAGRISSDDASTVANQRLLADLVEETRRDHAEAMDEVARLLGDLERQCRLMAELPEQRSLPFTTKRRSVRETAVLVEALAERVAALRNVKYRRPEHPSPQLTAFKASVPDDVLRILRWALPPGVSLLAIADVNVERLVGDNAYLGVTPEKFFVSAQNAIRKEGSLDREFPLSDVRYVRFRERGKQGPVLDVITTGENVRLTFDGWAARGAGLEDARRIGNVLASAMNLPEEERRTDPLLALESATG